MKDVWDELGEMYTHPPIHWNGCQQTKKKTQTAPQTHLD